MCKNNKLVNDENLKVIIDKIGFKLFDFKSKQYDSIFTYKN